MADNGADDDTVDEGKRDGVPTAIAGGPAAEAAATGELLRWSKQPISVSSHNTSSTTKPGRPLRALSESLLHLKGTDKKLIIATMGLPGRGKTFLARKLSRYLNWMSYSSCVFTVGTRRRHLFGARKDHPYTQDKEKLEPELDLQEKRRQAQDSTRTDMWSFLNEQNGQVAIYDGHNVDADSRNRLRDFIETKDTKGDVSLVWIEVIVTDEALVEENIRSMCSGPDYQGMSEDKVLADFRYRVKRWEKSYISLGDEDESYIQIINSGARVITNQIHGYLIGKIVFFVMSFRAFRHDIYLSRHGESEFNVDGKLGGDSCLSSRGRQFGSSLANFVDTHETLKERPLTAVWCSTMKRTMETASYIKHDRATTWRALQEIDAGICDGLTYEEVEEHHPTIFADRSADKLRYRYPAGESYEDVIRRLEPVIFELNRLNGSVLVIGHRAVLRCLYAYFLDMPSADIPHLSVPLHTVIKLSPTAYGCEETRFEMGVSSVDDAISDEATPKEMAAAAVKAATIQASVQTSTA